MLWTINSCAATSTDICGTKDDTIIAIGTSDIWQIIDFFLVQRDYVGSITTSLDQNADNEKGG